MTEKEKTQVHDPFGLVAYLVFGQVVAAMPLAVGVLILAHVDGLYSKLGGVALLALALVASATSTLATMEKTKYRT